MKKYLIYIIAIALGLSLTSCEDFLKEEAYGNPTTEELLKDPENLSKLVGQAYAELKWLHDHWGYWGLNTLTSDEARCPVRNPGNNWDDSGYWASLNTMDWNYETEAFELVWDKCIAGATLCNKILKQIAPYKDEPGIKENYQMFSAELCVLRSYYYYTMFDMFGRIPYTEEYPDSEDAQIPLMSTSNVWKALVTCLETYTPQLQTASADMYGRATQGVGNMLLARLYLNAKSFDVDQKTIDEKMGAIGCSNMYQACVKYCDNIINSGSYHIESNFFNNFLVYNQSSQENIFVIVENGNGSFDYQDVAGKMSNKLRLNLLTQPYAFQTLYGLLEKPWNGFAASPEFLALYDAKDRRGPCDPYLGTKVEFQDINTKYGWFLGPVYDEFGFIVQDENKNDVIIVSTFGDKVSNCSWNDGARCMKYETEKNSTVNKYMENDFVLLRYADVLYMKAEACLNGGGDINSLLGNSDFQLIRTRAGLEPYTSLDADELLDERGRELAWENVRRRDLIRHGKYTGDNYMWTFKKAQDDSRKWFPIPKKFMEMHVNDREPWTQNPGY
ncbi:MAG: RagB/SusD family nutrient uptake outer membrane protein [Paludibacteraceae bacterium]|nr:RagB/SusD family nutrient uptake outer membrane protein [Paludibacteraceae bacterium]